MSGEQAEDGGSDLGCGVCQAILDGEVDQGLFIYVALVPRDSYDPERTAEKARKRFGIDVSPDDVEMHVENNHGRRRNFT